MAVIRSLTHNERSVSQLHPTEVDCRWQIIRGPHGVVLFQLSTYGSDNRESEPKVSQTIQLDRAIATQLVTHLQEAFDL